MENIGNFIGKIDDISSQVFERENVIKPRVGRAVAVKCCEDSF